MVLLSASHVQSSPFHICFVLQHSSKKILQELNCIVKFSAGTMLSVNFLDFRETETDLIWPIILRHLVMTYFYLKWFISLFHFLDFVITLPVSIRYQQHRSMAKKILTWRKEYTTLTVFEENILRISLVLLLNICGMTKFKRDINSNKLFWTGVPVSSKRFFAYSSKVKNSNKKH